MSEHPASRPLLRAYVDETGDRGFGPKSSEFFAFACVLIADEHEAGLREEIRRLRCDLAVPVGKPLHWKEHVKTFDRREHVAANLAALPHLGVTYLVVHKPSLPVGSAMRTDQAVFYNYAAGLVVEQALRLAAEWPAGPRDALIRFGHVRGFDHRQTVAHIRRRREDTPEVPWHLLLRGSIQFDGQGDWDGLQAADQYAGMLSVAMRPNRFGRRQPHHLCAILEQVLSLIARTEQCLNSVDRRGRVVPSR